MTRVKIKRTTLYIFSYSLAVIFLFPIFWMVFTSIQPSGTPVSILREAIRPPYTLANYQYVIDVAPIIRWTFNSTFVAIITTLLTLILSSLAAYSISKISFRGKNVIFWIIIAGLMVPTEATLVPLFLTVLDLGLINSYSGLIFPTVALPFGVLILKQFYDGIPNELTEAAKIDGASTLRIWWSIYIPLSTAAMAALGIFTFIQSWNNFMWPLVAITSQNMMTLPIGIPAFQDAYSGDLTAPMAANMLASIPAIIIFILFQKHIIKGIANTGIKG